MDYDSTAINATFTAGYTSAMVNVPVTVDGIVERPETFDLRFTILSSLQRQIMPGVNTTAVGIILDDTSKKRLVILNVVIVHNVSYYGGI